MASLFNKAKAFPRDRNTIIALEKSNELENGNAILIFKNLESGLYAVAIMHGEFMNDDMNGSIIGIPKEGYCLSKNVKAALKTPSFRYTNIWIEMETTIKVEMRYWGRT